MATWTTLPDAALEPGKPIRSIDGLALRDNPIAIAQGAAGAPKISLLALETITPGAVVRSRYDEQVQTDSGSFVTIASFGFIQTGTLRFTWEHRGLFGNFNESTTEIARRRNGVQTTIVSFTTSSTSFVSRSVDVSVILGDTLIFSHRTFEGAFGGSSFISILRNFRLQTNGEYWWPAVTNQRME
jgi:hypothetical protein